MISALSQAEVSSVNSARSTGRPSGPRPSADEVFKKLDSDNKGYLTQSDLVKISPAGAKAAESASADDAKAQAAFKRMDTDGDGKVTESEFKAAAPPQRSSEGGSGASAKAGAPSGPPPGGAASSGSSSAAKEYDPADANKDGKVTEQEQETYDAQKAQANGAQPAGKAITPQAAEAVKAYDAVAQAAD